MIITPNLFVIGVPKAGTSALVYNLGKHPEIFVPAIKEPRYFDAEVFYDEKSDYPIKQLKDYLSLYEQPDLTKASYSVDGSVFNVYSQNSIKNILQFNRNAKFIVILRDPVDAVKSMFSQRLKYVQPQFREISDDFNVCWDTLEDRKNGKRYPKGCRNKFLFRYDQLYSYEKFLPQVISLVEEKNIFVASYKEMVTDPDIFYKKVSKYLGLNSELLYSEERINGSFHVKPTVISSLIGGLVFSTMRYRQRLGFTGDKFQNLKKLIQGKKIKVPNISNESDGFMREKFKDTYKYLEELNIKF